MQQENGGKSTVHDEKSIENSTHPIENENEISLSAQSQRDILSVVWTVIQLRQLQRNRSSRAKKWRQITTSSGEVLHKKCVLDSSSCNCNKKICLVIKYLSIDHSLETIIKKAYFLHHKRMGLMSILHKNIISFKSGK